MATSGCHKINVLMMITMVTAVGGNRIHSSATEQRGSAGKTSQVASDSPPPQEELKPSADQVDAKTDPNLKHSFESMLDDPNWQVTAQRLQEQSYVPNKQAPSFVEVGRFSVNDGARKTSKPATDAWKRMAALLLFMNQANALPAAKVVGGMPIGSQPGVSRSSALMSAAAAGEAGGFHAGPIWNQPGANSQVADNMETFSTLSTDASELELQRRLSETRDALKEYFASRRPRKETLEEHLAKHASVIEMRQRLSDAKETLSTFSTDASELELQRRLSETRDALKEYFASRGRRRETMEEHLAKEASVIEMRQRLSDAKETLSTFSTDASELELRRRLSETRDILKDYFASRRPRREHVEDHLAMYASAE